MMRTYTGRSIDPYAIVPSDIDLFDIARGLSHVCRFAGQLPRFYSVAQHSVMVGDLLPDDLKLYGYLHDGAEAFIGDLSRSIKHDHRMYAFRNMEDRILRVIAYRFGLDFIKLSLDPDIKAADNLAALFERWTVQRGEAWDPEAALKYAFDSNFLGAHSPKHLVPLLQRLPSFWEPWDPPHAYGVLVAKVEAAL